MKYFFFLTGLFMAFGCQTAKDRNAVGPGRHATLLAKYKEVSFDTLAVFSQETMDSSYAFYGRLLDSSEARFFPSHISDGYDLQHGFFACYQFPIDGSRIALITRMPSDYISTQVKLFIFDTQKDSITGSVNLADYLADAGDEYIKSSWLFKEGSQPVQCFGRVMKSFEEDVDKEEDRKREVSEKYYLIDLSKPGLDTVSTDKDQLAQRFQQLIDRDRKRALRVNSL